MKRLKELDEYLLNLTNLKGLENRFSLLQLNDLVSDFLGFNVEFEELSKETLYIDDRIGVNLSLENGNEVYIDIFYITDNDENMVITEYTIDAEYALSLDDYNHFITYSDQSLLSKNSAYAFYIDNLDRFDELANVLREHDRFMGSSEPKDSLYGWFYTLIDEIKNVREIDFPLGG